MTHRFFSGIFLLATLASSYAQTWDGNGTPQAGGNWSKAQNWSPDTVPGAGNTAALGDVTSGARTVIYDASEAGTLGTLQIKQSTSGATNLLSLQKSLSVATAIILGATGGTVQITVDAVTPAANVTLAVPGGATLNAGGILSLTVAEDSTLAGNVSGNLTISGGTLLMASATTPGCAVNTVAGTLAMSSGTISIDNEGSGVQSDRRLWVRNNVNITGGAISTTKEGQKGGGMLVLSGVANTIDATSLDEKVLIVLDQKIPQTLTTNNALVGGLLLRGSGAKTIVRTGGSTIHSISLIDSSGKGTSLMLGSDLTLASDAAQPSAAGFSQSAESGAVQVGIDANGHVLNLTAGATSGTWTPNNSRSSGVSSTAWDLSNSGAADAGVIKANAFDLNAAGVTTTVGSGLVLEAAGGSSSANNLGGTSAIAADSTFRYSGSAALATPATLTSDRAIGKLEVSGGGALRIDSASGIAGATTASAGTLILSASGSLGGTPSVTLGSAGTLNTSAQAKFTMPGAQPFKVTLDPAGAGAAGRITATGLDITKGVVSFTALGTLDDPVYIIASYTKLTGTAFSSVSGLPNGYTIAYNHLGGNQIALVRAAQMTPTKKP